MILFVAYGGGHIALLHRLFKYFKDQGESCNILPLTTAVAWCNNYSGEFDYIRLEDHLDLIEIEESWKGTIRDIVTAEHNNSIGIPFEHSLAYYTIGLAGLFREEGFEAGLNTFRSRGRVCLRQETFAEKLIIKLGITSVFSTNVSRMERAFIRAGNKLKIKTFSADDLFGTPIDPIEAKVVFADNEMAKENLLRQSPDLKVYVTGNPVFQDLKAKVDKAQTPGSLLILLQTGIRNLADNSVIHFDAEFYKVFFRSIERFLKNFDSVHVRFHPSMTKTIYWNENQGIEIDDEPNIHESIGRFEYALGMTSTALYEAYLFGNKVYVLNFGGDFFRLPIDSAGTINTKGEVGIRYGDYRANISSSKLKSTELIYKIFKNEVSHN